MSLTNSLATNNGTFQYKFQSTSRPIAPLFLQNTSPLKDRPRIKAQIQPKPYETPKKANYYQFRPNKQINTYSNHRRTVSAYNTGAVDDMTKTQNGNDMLVQSSVSEIKSPFNRRAEGKTIQQNDSVLQKKQTDYNSIKRLLTRKQMLINELKKLSETEEQLKMYKTTSCYQKSNTQLVSPIKSVNYKNSDSIDSTNNDRFKLSLSTVATKYSREDFNRFKQQSQEKSATENYAETLTKSLWLQNKKNPEENMDYFKKPKQPQFRPYQTKSQFEIAPQLRLTQVRKDKRIANNVYETSNKFNTDNLLYNSCKNTQQAPISQPMSANSIYIKRGSQLQEISYENDIKNNFKTNNQQNGLRKFSNNRKPNISDFQISKKLGQGKFGIVCQAIHKQTNSIYAIKKIKKELIIKNKLIDQFSQQIKIHSYCSQQNILKFYGFFDDSEYIYLVLEYMENGTLYSLLKKCKKMSQLEASGYLKETASAIAFLHQRGIAHRDIKPQNVVISHGVGKLCDFGWATRITDRRKTCCGTFDYTAPEIIQGSQYDMSVDLWCLGVMAYELLVGKAPFYNISRKQTMKSILNVQKQALNFPQHLSKKAVSFIQGLIRRNPQQRMDGKQILTHPFLNLSQD